MKMTTNHIKSWVGGLSLAVLMTFSACEKKDNLFDLDINVDPNNPTQGSVRLLLPEAERNLVGFLAGLRNTQMGMAGQIGASDSYGFGGNAFYGSWSYFYTSPGKDIDEIIKAAMPIFICDENWHYGRKLIKPILGWVTTLDVLGYDN